MIVPQGLVQVPSWNSYPVRSPHLIVRQHNDFHLVVICLVSVSCFSVHILYQQGKKSMSRYIRIETGISGRREYGICQS
jgi:hypothetical protein